MTNPRLFLASLVLAVAASAAPRTSVDYAITAETLDFGGQRVASADYTIDGSLGPVVGISSEATSVTVAKHGYIGQLYELAGYSLWATDVTPDELGTTQVFPMRLADDGTGFPLSAAGFSFSIVSGPLTSMTAGGLVTAGAVYGPTPATVSGNGPGFPGPLSLTLQVQDTLPDNFGTYAGDGLTDAWQVQHFGVGNPLAAPGLDPDGDGQSNIFEFTAGLVPTDPASFFRLRIEDVPGPSERKRLVFSPVFSDRTYTVKARTALDGGSAQPLGDQSTDGLLPERSVTDLSAGGGRKFYQVEIVRP